MLQLRRLSPASATSIAGRLRKSPAGRVIVVVSAVGGSGQVHQPGVGREQPPDQAQGGYHRGGGGGGAGPGKDDPPGPGGLERGGGRSGVMGRGRNTRPVALVVSICGVSAARSAARMYGAAACRDAWPSARRASTSSRLSRSSSVIRLPARTVAVIEFPTIIPAI